MKDPTALHPALTLRWPRHIQDQVFVGLLTVLGAGFASRLSAQATPSDTLPAVHVTVLRTPFDVTRAPLDVASVGARDIAVARPGFSVDEALGQVAGIQVDNRLNFAIGERLSVRGIGVRSQFGTRGVRVLVDDIPATLADGQSALNNIDMGSLGLAEAIRGPASALYGNASAGVISFRTLPPPPVAFAPNARVMSGSDGLARFQLGVGGMKGRGSYVVNADRLDYAGYRAYSHARNAHVNAVGTWDWDRVSLKLVGNGVQYSAENPGSLSDSLLNIDRRQAYSNNLKQRTGERGRQNQLGASMRAQLGLGELRLSAYGLTRSINNPIPTSIIGIHRAAGGVRAAYAVTEGNTDRNVTAMIGGESDLQRDDRRNWANRAGVAGALTLDQRERVTSTSPFLQLSATAGKLTFLGGVRYDQFRFEAQDHLINANNPDDSGVRTMTSTSPTLGVTYAVMPLLSLYANVSNGFQTPTTTELANRPSGAGGFNPTLRPEHTHSHEAGIKGRAGSMSYDLAAYDMRIDDELIPFEVASAAGRQFYRNAGTARHRGIDASATALLGSSMQLHGTYSFTDARYVSYDVASGTGTTSYASNRVPGVAPNLASLSLDVGNPDARFVSVEERYRSNILVNDANTASAPASVVTNLRGSIRVGAASLFGGVGNLFDEVYDTSVSINAFGGRYFDPAAGRTFYVGVDLRR
ncbi:MAG TPA: TonB-dependent receptor [Gemmatimonadaceae bacterium]|nr:TonB-dependent receptor [Gemmatimonadaceae bacterium]